MTTPAAAHVAVPLVRIARKPDPCAWPPRHRVGSERFDDPERVFRTLYLAESRTACFLEVLAHFRPEPALLAAGAITGAVPSTWRDERLVGTVAADPAPAYLDLRAIGTRQYLRTLLADRLRDLGLADLDVSGVCGPRRELTQAIARWAREHGYAGVAYHSRHGTEHTCWALFEGVALFATAAAPQAIAAGDPDYLRVCALFGLTPA